MKRKLLPCMLGTMLFCAFAAFSETESLKLTVDDAVKYALENSRTLKSSAIDLEIKKRAKNTSWNVFVPSVSVSGTMTRSNKWSNPSAAFAPLLSASGMPVKTEADGESDYWKAVGNLSVQLPLNLAYVESIHAAKKQYEAGLISYEQSLKETELNIRKMFYALLLQQENVKLQNDSLENARKRYEQSLVSFQNGRTPELSVLQAQVTYESKKPAITDLEQSLRQQIDTFVFLLGLPLGTKIELDGLIEPEFVIVSAPDLVQKHVENRLDIQTVKKNIDLLKTSLRASRFSTFTPSFILGWSWNPIVANINDDWSNYTDQGSFTATLSFDIGNMLPFSSNMQKAKDTKQQIEKLELTLDNAVQNAEMEIYKLVDSLNLAYSKITVDQRTINLAQRAYDMTLAAYYNGTTEQLEVRDAENSLNQAKLGMINDKYTYIANLLDLEYAINSKLH